MSEWRSIDSAPINEFVLVGSSGSSIHSPKVVMALQYEKGCWNHTGSKWSHWMPLPEPPK